VPTGVRRCKCPSRVDRPAETRVVLLDDVLVMDESTVQDQVCRRDNASFVRRPRWPSDWDVYRHCSADAYYYLLFQTYLIVYLLFVSVVCLTVVLPVNFHGRQGASHRTATRRRSSTFASHLGTNERKFARTTIANLSATSVDICRPLDTFSVLNGPGCVCFSSPLLWIHACVSILFVLVGIVVAYLYTNATRYYVKEDMVSRHERHSSRRESTCLGQSNDSHPRNSSRCV
jgi:hypothetical protein